MHIAFFNRSFYPETAATSQLLTELSETLVRNYGCRVSVVAGIPLSLRQHGAESTEHGAWSREQGTGRSEIHPVISAPCSMLHAPGRFRGYILSRERYSEIEILRARGTCFSKKRFIGRFSNYLTYFLSACYAGLRVDRPDVIVALTDPPIIGLAAYLAAQRFRVPLIVSYRDIFPEAGRLLEDFHSTVIDRTLERVNHFLVQRADRVVALGKTMRQKLVVEKGADPLKTIVIPDWADCTEIAPGPKRNPFSEASGLADKFVVMHSGNIGLSQAPEILLRAAACLRHISDIEIVFVGDGVKKGILIEDVRRFSLQNVRFLPFQPKESLKQSFAAADVFVISLKRGLAGVIVPSKLYGILAAGRPYVAAVEDACEVATIATKYKCGLVANPEDGEDLAGKILSLYRNRDLAQRLGENARNTALRFDRKLGVEAYYRLFREVIAKSRRQRSEVREQRSEIRTQKSEAAKRALDIVLSGLGLILSFPLWVTIAAAVKVEDGGPVFYGQERVGQYGRRFKSWKFRSMLAEAHQQLQAKDHDPRITKVGRFLRATAMDEIPQLWNILVGDMSFVGPRALMPEEIEVNSEGAVVPMEGIPGYKLRHQVPPGLTGVAQIYTPRDIPRQRKFRYDLLYIQKQSFWLDLKLIGLSFWITLRGRWEDRGDKF